MKNAPHQRHSRQLNMLMSKVELLLCMAALWLDDTTDDSVGESGSRSANDGSQFELQRVISPKGY